MKFSAAMLVLAIVSLMLWAWINPAAVGQWVASFNHAASQGATTSEVFP